MCTLCNPDIFRRGFLRRLAAMAGVSAIGGTIVAALARDRQEWLPPEILGIRVPDSDVSVAAVALMRAAAPPVLFNHCLRTFLLGAIDARRRAQRVDEEAVFVASILHDLALVEKYAGDLTKSFEQNGAEYAERFVRDKGFSDDRAEKVAKSILLHVGQASGQGADIEFVMIGAGQDVFGPNLQQLPDDQLVAMEREVPRLQFRSGFVALMKDHVGRSKQPTWTADFARNPPSRFLNSRWSE